MQLKKRNDQEWLEVDNEQKAIEFYMPSSNIYETSLYLSMDYVKQKDMLLQIELVQLYNVPHVNPNQNGYSTSEFYSLL